MIFLQNEGTWLLSLYFSWILS